MMSEQPSVTLETSYGSVVLELYWQHAPKTCKNFYDLVKRNYYDGVSFHRLIPDFMLQGGDPTGTGRGGEAANGGTIDDEITRQLKHTGAGILCMANAGPNTNGSQFYLTLAPCPWLDGKHSIFGRVASGMKVVKRMSLVATDATDRPLEPITITRAFITQEEAQEKVAEAE